VADKLQNSRTLLRRLTWQAQRGGGVPAARKRCGISNTWSKHSVVVSRHLEEETDHPMLVSMRLLIEEYAEVVAALTHFRTPGHEGSKSSTIKQGQRL